MPYSDTKTRKVRGKSWTQADERRWLADQKRQRKADEKAKLEFEREVAKMKRQGTYEAYLETEKQKKQAEEESHKQWVLDQKQRLDKVRINKSADARLMAGQLQSEFASAIGWRDRFGQPEGDWLDDPVEALTTGYGFGEEVRTSRGIKMQVNLCLDCSNSMVHNRLDNTAKETIQNFYLGLRMASSQLPTGSLVVNVWTWANGDDGRSVSHVNSKSEEEKYADSPMGALEYNYWAQFDGEDTWISPLLDRLERWENRYGDPTAFRLDIVITDGVLEHPTDAREGDKIQERRDGALQTVVLNFLPVEDWSDSRVPKRCVQYPATDDNLVGLMRGVLGAWLVNLA